MSTLSWTRWVAAVLACCVAVAAGASRPSRRARARRPSPASSRTRPARCCRASPSRPSSPALIEKVRAAVTDGQGQYKIVELRPGTYTVTFTLPGFCHVQARRHRADRGFTATVNADMRVGALEETITVTGAAPLVDVQSVTQQK